MRATMSKEGKDLTAPDWAGATGIDERKFCRDFSVQHPLLYSEGHFFSTEGMEPEDRIRKYVYDYVACYYSSDLHRIVSGLVEALKLEYHRERFPVEESVIHFANGTFRLYEGLSPQKEPCRYRLPVNYNPDAPRPALWLKFLEELLEPEDIPTLQEFMGYCLVPVNYAQKMLILVGSGGEGKSRIGVVMSHLLGECMCNGSLTKLEKSPFARADLQNRLVMVDDDLQMEALTTTGHIKSIVTAEQRMDLERKGIQSYQGTLFCRLMAFGNGSLRSLHDRSYGFFRRQIILTVKARDPKRRDDPFLAQRLRKELEGIAQWALNGLERLIQQDMQFTISPRALQNLQQAESEGNNALDFMDSQGYIRLDPMSEVTCRRLYSIYCEWCDDNSLTPLSSKTFTASLVSAAHRYNIIYSNHIPGGNGRQVRGFRGLRGLV